MTGSFAFDDVCCAINGYYNEEYLDEFSIEAQDFIKSMIQVDPSKRASIDELLNHRWIKKKYIEYNKQHLRRNEERNAAANPPKEIKDPYDKFTE